MKLNYLYGVLLLAFLQVNAQNKNQLNEDVARQEIMKFNSPKTVSEALISFSSEYGLAAQNTFTALKSNVDRNGVEHTRHQQYYKGLKVEFGTAITHATRGNVSLINGELYVVSHLNTVPTISSQAAFANAVNMVGATSYLWEDANQAKLMNYQKPKGDLLIFPDVKTGNVHLAYKFDVYATAPISREEIYVDAHTGKFLYTNPIIKHADRLISSEELKLNSEKVASIFETSKNDASSMLITGTAATRFSGSRSIETIFSGGDYVLQDVTRGNGINTYDCERADQYQTVDFTDNDNNWTSGEHANANKDDGALDAHWGAEMTYDFWSNIFSRNSFDDNGATINSYVHYDDVPGGAGYRNAFWNGSVMTYGDGSGGWDILTALDVCGHEIGHAVTTYTANLAYQNQSGGMNEGYSDIWGACIEHYGRTGALTGTLASGVWIIGEDINGGLRSMSNPNSGNSPDTYLGTYWRETGDEGSCVPSQANDNCGVHFNSGVLNHWFYILTDGASGTNNAPAPDTYNVTGIGMTKSSEIAYLTLRDYLTANSTYADARAATIAVVESLYCPASPEAIAVTNAWFAVNVGDEFANVAKDVALTAVPENANVNCGATFSQEITIVNGGTTSLTSVDISYNIDGGANTNETWTGNLSICEQTNYTLTINGLTRGTHTLNVTTTTNSDGRPGNNSKSSIIVVNDAGTENVINPFTNTSDILIAYDEGAATSMWERGLPWSGAPGRALTTATSGNSEVYATNLAGLHDHGTRALLVSQCYDLSLLDNTFVKFDLAYDIEEDWDLLYMEYSTDGGTSWSLLGASTDPDWYNSNRSPNGADCFNCVGGQWTGEAADASTHSGGGTNGTMHTYSKSLAAFDGTGTGETNMLFRFVYHSDEAAAEEGAMIDNFRIEGVVNPLLAVDNFEYEDLVIYPNPTSNMVTIVSSLNLEDTKVSIIDLRGRVIGSQTTAISINKLEVNLSSLASGAYLLIIENGVNKSVKQIIKN